MNMCSKNAVDRWAFGGSGLSMDYLLAQASGGSGLPTGEPTFRLDGFSVRTRRYSVLFAAFTLRLGGL